MLKLKRNVGKIAALVATATCLVAGPSWADVGPPPGKVRVGAMYGIKAPKEQPKQTLILIRTSQRDKGHLALVPFTWERPIKPSTCYRCQTKLVALSSAQAQKLVALLEQHPALAKAQKVLKKFKGEAKLKWLTRISFESLTEASQTAKAKPITQKIVAFFEKEKYPKSRAFMGKVTVDKKHQGQAMVQILALDKIGKDAITFKVVKSAFSRAPGAKRGYYGRRRRNTLARNPWFYGSVMLLLIAVFFTTRKKRR